jgi:hypothetical protein
MEISNYFQTNNAGFPPIHLFVPFKDSDFRTISIRVVLPTPDSKLFSNKKFELENPKDPISFDVPSLKITGMSTITAGGTNTMHISHVVNGEPTGRDSTVDLIAQNGYLPKTRLELHGGEADFKVTALGLEPGDQMKIKAGFFFFPSRSEFVLNVE